MGLTREDLHGYQHRVSNFIIDKPRCACFVDLGLGKTVSSLTAVADLLDSIEICKTLVVAPLRPARKVWSDEIENWAHTKHLRYSKIVGSAKERLAALQQKSDIDVINVDNVVWLEKQLGRKGKLPWDMIIIDESSGFQNRDTQRFKTMRRLSRRVERFVELTATPATRGLIGLWAQFYLLDGGERLGPTFTGFKERYFLPVSVGEFVTKWIPRRGASKAIYQRIKDITITLKAKDYLKLPEKINRVVKVDLSPEEWEKYNTLQRDYILEMAGGGEIEAVSAAALATKLLQLANGQIYDADRSVHEVHAGKIDALKEIVEGNQHEPLLVAYSYQSDRDRILRTFPEAVHLGRKNPDAIIDQWNRGEIPILVAHPASAGHGLNLQYGGRHIVWYGVPWSLELYLQFNARLYRQGQTRPVIIHHILAEGTIDERVMSVLALKNSTQEALLNALKDLVADEIL